MNYRKLYILFLLVLFSCREHREEAPHSIEINDSTQLKTEVSVSEISEIEQVLIQYGLVDIQKIDSTIRIDVKYATTENFMHKVLYANYSRVYLQKEVAERLKKCQSALKKKDSTLSLLVYDGARPLFVQQEMWDGMDTIPIPERTKFLSNPKSGSLHNFGCAVDLTIVDVKTGKPLDMGAGYDDIRKIAYPRFETYYLQLGELSPYQINNRKLLREVMKVGGFWVIETEWWHFNAYSRDKAKELFEIIP
ncbi:MAG: M15 family metallopeptidase [Brumimicrobium sp.]|nr:M15 family metallopeptidase [Brumimicrobium sp.]